ncbi:MAG: cysteine desulfurase NifS [Dethiobacteria bacterium]
MKPIYMDHSATTPVDPEVFYEMKPYFTDSYGNASSVHRFGQNARRAVEKAREQVAKLINASPREIVFTSGGTEADNQAIVSYMTAVQSKGKHIITSAIEHHAVLETCRHLAKQDFDLSVLPVTPEGIVEEEALQAALKPESRLVSIMHANNEIGTVQNIKELAAIAHEAGAVFHTDAVQTLGKIPIDVKAMGIDMLSGSSHKLYGPKGVGCLYIKKGLRVPGLLHGGGQEGKLRAGTENVPAIVGFGKACELAQQNMAKRKEHLEKLSKRLQEGILNTIPNTLLTGHSSQRLPGNVSVCFEFVEGESILLMLDSYGIMASSGSACTSGALDPSHVLMALGLPHEIAHGSLRLTLGKDNTEEDVERVLEVLPGIIANLRRISPISN